MEISQEFLLDTCTTANTLKLDTLHSILLPLGISRDTKACEQVGNANWLPIRAPIVMSLVVNVELHVVSIDDDSILAMTYSYHPLCVNWPASMHRFSHNESLGADVMRNCKGYVSIKDDAGLLINQRPVLDISSMSSSDGDAKCMKDTR